MGLSVWYKVRNGNRFPAMHWKTCILHLIKLSSVASFTVAKDLLAGFLIDFSFTALTKA